MKILPTSEVTLSPSPIFIPLSRDIREIRLPNESRFTTFLHAQSYTDLGG